MPLAPILPNEPRAQTNCPALNDRAAVPDAPPLLPLKNLLTAFDAAATELYDAKQAGRARGPVTGLQTLDAELTGALMPGLHFAHGSPGVGKTAFALQIAATCGCPALFVTCEISPLELLRRHTARVTQTYLNKFKTGELPPADASAKVRRAVAAAPGLVLLDGTAAYADATAIVGGAEVTRTADAGNPHFLLIVDSLHAWAASAPFGGAEYERLAEHLAGLKRIAAALNCPVLVIAERNRQSMEKGGMSGAAGHRGIEYGGETIIELDMKADAVPDVNGEKPLTVRLTKNRHGQGGKTVDLLFNGGFQTYREKDAR